MLWLMMAAISGSAQAEPLPGGNHALATATQALAESGVHPSECGCLSCTASDYAGGDDFDDSLFPPHIHDPDHAVLQFTLGSGKWPQAFTGDPVTITYSYNNFLDGGLRDSNGVSLPAGFIRASVETAFSLWAEVAPLHFVEVPDEGGPVPTGNYADGQFGQIRFHHRYINGPDFPGQTPKAKAQAYYPTGSSNIAGDVFFDNGDPWQEVGELAIPDVLGAATHEIGHTLGIAHSLVPEANMYWVFRRTSGLADAWLHPDDIAAVRAVYGMGTGSVTPMASHVPEPTAVSLLACGLGIASFTCRRRRRRNCGWIAKTRV